MYYSTIYKSPIGNLTIACDEKENLVGLWMENQKYFGASILDDLVPNENIDVLVRTKKWLDDYFEGKRPSIFELPLKPLGSEFRQDVWKILCEIPYGQTITYKEISKKIAVQRNINTMSAQAIGGAVGHNPISIIIPCHRVIGTNNSITGYAGGLLNKIELLKHEGYDVSKLVIQKDKEIL